MNENETSPNTAPRVAIAWTRSSISARIILPLVAIQNIMEVKTTTANKAAPPSNSTWADFGMAPYNSQLEIPKIRAKTKEKPTPYQT